MPALIRDIPDSYLGYYAERGVTIDLALARRQHAAYAGALARAGAAVQRVPADERFPDCMFIEDTAVLFGDIALEAGMAAHREGEQRGVLPFLPPGTRVIRLPAGGRLDGGDVLHAGDRTYVGRSGRTNAAGAAALRAMLAPRPVIEVAVEHCLHLKSAATWLGADTMLIAPEWIDAGAFAAHRLIETAPGESKAANTLRIGATLLGLAGYPGTLARLRGFAGEAGATVVPLDMSEAEKGDGSLTCLSIVW